MTGEPDAERERPDADANGDCTAGLVDGADAMPSAGEVFAAAPEETRLVTPLWTCVGAPAAGVPAPAVDAEAP